MTILRDDGFYLVAMRCEHPTVFTGAGCAVCIFRPEMRKIPDAIFHAVRVVVDEGDLFRRIHLRQRSHTRSGKKAEIFVLLATQVSIEEFRMCAIVDCGQNVGVHVVHGFAMQQELCKSDCLFSPMAHLIPPMVEDRGCFGRGRYITAQSRSELCANFRGEPENCFCKVFVNLGFASPTLQFVGIEGKCGLKIEVAFPKKDRAGVDPIHGTQESKCAFLKLESCAIPLQSEIVEAKRLSQPDIAQPPVNGVGIIES